MAQITTVALRQNTILKPGLSSPAYTITTRFSPTELAANVTSGDTILLATLPKDTRILDAGVRVLDAVGLANGFITARIQENSVNYTITNPVSTTYSGSAAIVSAPPPVDGRYVKSWELVIGGNSIDSTATGIIECTVHVNRYGESG